MDHRRLLKVSVHLPRPTLLHLRTPHTVLLHPITDVQRHPTRTTVVCLLLTSLVVESTRIAVRQGLLIKRPTGPVNSNSRLLVHHQDDLRRRQRLLLDDTTRDSTSHPVEVNQVGTENLIRRRHVLKGLLPRFSSNLRLAILLNGTRTEVTTRRRTSRAKEEEEVHLR